MKRGGWSLRLTSLLIDAVAVLVPAWRRDEWRREWRGELHHRWQRIEDGDELGEPAPTSRPDLSRGDETPDRSGSGSVAHRPPVASRYTARSSSSDLLRRALGAVRHALWLRCREWRPEPMLHDLRHAARNLIRAPVFTTLTVLTLAIGIGANTFVFSFANALLLRPWPYAEPDRLVRLQGIDRRSGQRANLSYPDLLDLRARSETLAGVAGTDREPFNLGIGERAEYVQGAQVDAELFEVLGVEPLLGRTFRREENLPGAANVVVLGEQLWRSAFGADPQVVGRDVRLDGEPYTIIGIVPRGAAYPDEALLWKTLRLEPGSQRRGARWVNAVARLAPGVTAAQVSAELDLLAAQLAVEHPETNEGVGVVAIDLREFRTRALETPVLLLLGVVGFVLLIACSNVAGLLLARAATRRREMAVRAALGARRMRLVRQLLVEAFVLSAAAAALGLPLGAWCARAIDAMIPVAVPDWVILEVDARVVGYALAISALATLAFAVVPALQISRTDLGAAMKEGAGHATLGDRRQRLRSVLVVAEVAMSIVLLVSAGLMVRSLIRWARVDTGFEAANGFMMTTAFAETRYPDGEARVAFFAEARRRLEGLPGVEAVGGIAQPPLRGGWSMAGFTVEGQRPDEQESNPPTFMHLVTPGYIEAAGIPLLRGRDLSETDAGGPVERVLINRELARRFFGDRDPLGERLRFGAPGEESFMQDPWMEIVGVVADTKQVKLGAEAAPEIYYLYPRWADWFGRITWVVRTGGAPRRVLPLARAEIQALDADQALYDVLTLEELVAASIWESRLFTTLFWIFGGIALLLASIGIYGLVGASIAQRTREIGLRMAMGARGPDVVAMVLRQSLLLAALGVAIGLPSALALSRLMSSLLYEVSTSDPLVYASATAALALVAFLAALLPARRATRVDPVIALRAE